jgi:hypothetical protein
VEHGQVWSLPLDEFGYRTPTASDGERVVWRSENVGRLFELLAQVVNLDIQWPKRLLSDVVEPDIQEPKSGGRSTTVTEGHYVTEFSLWWSQTVNSEQKYAQKMVDSTSATKEGSVDSSILFPDVQSVNLVSLVIYICVPDDSVTIINVSKTAWHRRCAANSFWYKQCGHFVPTVGTLRHCTPRLLRSDYSHRSPVNQYLNSTEIHQLSRHTSPIISIAL